jgi:acetyltransferase
MGHSLDAIFRPRSIAVVGASRRKGTIGREVLHNLIEYEFNGKVFPVNPEAEVIHSIKCFPRVTDIPDAVDLAVIVVPKDAVAGVIDDCGAKGVRGLVVISAGFREVGPAGAELEAALVERIEKYGMRMVGPNCMGVINTDEGVRLDATFAPTRALPGRTAFMSQSGALGVALLNIARRMDLGFSMFASVGNKADISGNDLLEYWAEDEGTDLILMYLESFGNPRRFTQLARRISKTKPIIAVKAGRTAAGQRAASSHTGALAGAEVAIDALFEQCGVERVASVEELFDVALAFSHCPMPRGDRVAIVTNAGGPAILATDALVGLGLAMAELGEKTRSALASFLPAEASLANPVDLIAGANAESYGRALDTVLADPGVDAALAVFVPPVMVNPDDIVRAVSEVKERHEKPVLGVFMAPDEFFAAAHRVHRSPIPLYLFPESAARALAGMDRQRRWRERPAGQTPDFAVAREIARAVIDGVRAEGRLELNAPEALAILDAYGVQTSRYAFARTLEETIIAARGIGFPVVLKLVARDLSHKTDVGGVFVDIRNTDELVSAFMRLIGRVERHGLAGSSDGVMIQEMVRNGRELVLGMASDPHFGPVMMFGLGGVYVETLKDVAFRLWPLTDLDAREMIASIRSLPILEGSRGERPIDFAVIEETLLRLSQLVGDFDELAELDVNPFMATATAAGSKAVDARMRLKAP